MSESNEPQKTQSSIIINDPAPADPSKPAIPISYPLQTLEELSSRVYLKSFHYPFNKSSVPLQSTALENRPRILVCHDMKGGYIDDKWVQGGINEGAYAIWHWYLIDVFVYFSHYLVTLPPPCWTNTAHRHGVKVLGTFIVEGEQGRVTCNTLLATKESAQMYAERLTELAVALGFDGWLMNMEVDLDPGQIPNLKEFVSHLTQTMHSSVPGSLVIWYDSVTKDGNLSYQNELNEENKPFFDICDGLFANYSWLEDYPKQSAAVAGDRKFDVYMGIDVWGRGTYGGGQWTTNVGLDVLKKDEVSVALFAPGWVYETNQQPDFQTAQNHWWTLVEKSWGVINFYPKTLPFHSNFDQGHGYHISTEGGQVSNAPWNNLSSQSFQPFLEFHDETTPKTIDVLVDFKEASYSGGGNITFKGTLQDNTTFTGRLFLGKLILGKMPLYLTYSVKSDVNSLIGLSLQFSSTENEETSSVLIASGEANHFSSKFGKVIIPYQINNTEMAPGWVIQESSIEMHGYVLTEIHAICYRPKLEHSQQRTEYQMDGNDVLLKRGITAEFYAILGHITLKNSKGNSSFPPSHLWLVEGQHIQWSSGSEGSKILSVDITWKLKDSSDIAQFPQYNIYVEKLAKHTGGRLEGTQKYLGVANVGGYYVSELSIPSSASSLKFIIQVCALDGTCQELDVSPYLQLNVENQ